MSQISRHIILVGMMGVGKSSLGRRLSKRLNMPLSDSDFEIERAAGMGIRDLYNIYGELELRALERRILARLLADAPQVIATGGDAFADAESRALLKAGGITIWLKAGLDTLTSRIRRLDHRPLLEQGSVEPRLAELLTERERMYAEADLKLETDHKPVPQLIEELTGLLATHHGVAIPPLQR